MLPARNEARRIGGAIESILGQTLTNWELIVVDDGSTDGTADVVRAFGDARIRIASSAGSGLPAALNLGIHVARAPVVARQDADDRSLPVRLERQLLFLESRPDVAVVGSLWRETSAAGVEFVPRARFVSGQLNDALPHFNPVAHTSATFRKAAVRAVGGYDESLGAYGAEDYDLWLRLAASGAILWNLEDVLVVRVLDTEKRSARQDRAQLRAELTVRWREICRLRRANRPIGVHVRAGALRGVEVVLPIALKRLVRTLQGKAP